MPYTFCEEIDLLVPGRIDPMDAERQRRTAAEILRRFDQQPGVILADEVGMGKTFVALAVAVSIALTDRKRRPVVVMIPPALKEKWPKDFDLFCSRCVPSNIRARLACAIATRPVEFLKLLDDPPARRKQIIFLTHGAMSRGLYDKWTKLALIASSIKGRWGSEELRNRLSWQLPDLLGMKTRKDLTPIVWLALLHKHPNEWLEVLKRLGVDPEGNDSPADADDPVPQAIVEAVETLDLKNMYEVIAALPQRTSKYFPDYIKQARRRLKTETQEAWQVALKRMRLALPLLILDEAHHLKNPATQLASLFRDPNSRDDADAVSTGALASAFERMLFLTATPFQLGHHELCNVLDRFDGISWQSKLAPAMTRDEYVLARGELRKTLDAAQVAAVRLDHAWGRLVHDDLYVGEVRYADVDTWWPDAQRSTALLPAAGNVKTAYQQAFARMQQANEHLKPWVIRHLKARVMSHSSGDVPRRQRLAGRAIRDDAIGTASGLLIRGDALLPFLLAARATITAPDARPLFAEGLASAYETFLDTRRNNSGPLASIDQDGDAVPLDDAAIDPTDAQRWYLGHLERLVDKNLHERTVSHPKIDATVARTINLWERGEKVLIFCYYVVTGRVLRERISQALRDRISELASNRLGCPKDIAQDELERLGKRFFDEDSPLRRGCDMAVARLVKKHPELLGDLAAIVGIVRRFVRTPSFLTRYLLREGLELNAAGFQAAMSRADDSGLSLEQLISHFLEFLAERPEEKDRFLAGLNAVQTGSHDVRDVLSHLSDDEAQGAQAEKLLPNVRLVNGGTASETRQRLMLTFNTPFYPEILIASAVMAEGVDLHLNCRHVIHHDLSWNPSTLEQRTGRVDRIGAKCERARRPVQIYLPYLAETQDEKMYRVVMDRERWFGVVMGEKFEQGARATERLADRVPLAEAAARQLAFRLEV